MILEGERVAERLLTMKARKRSERQLGACELDPRKNVSYRYTVFVIDLKEKLIPGAATTGWGGFWVPCSRLTKQDLVAAPI